MTAYNVESILREQLSGFDDDLLNYVVSMVEEMSTDEKKSEWNLKESIGPFLSESGFFNEEEDMYACCKRIAVAFGGSGYKSSTLSTPQVASLALLSAPVKIIEKAVDLTAPKHSYGGVILNTAAMREAELQQHHQHGTASAAAANATISNSTLDVSAIPTTQRQHRKMRKENEQLQKILKVEAAARAKAEKELMEARLAAIKASRAVGRQANTGVNIERFSIPHPSGTADLLTDASLTLAPGRRYGLIGKNGAGKSTLMRYIANYKLPGLGHLKILLVDQHVEGDQDSALQWVLRADVERTSLLDDEARLLHYLHHGDGSDGNGNGTSGSCSGSGGSSGGGSHTSIVKGKEEKAGSTSTSSSSTLPDDLKGVNLEVALQECYERMVVIGVNTAEVRARKILEGLGFSEDTMCRPTLSLSGGWAMRAALAAALFVKPHLLLLDEPTNHLDLHALVWLERYLTTNFEGIAVIVSHDQMFLNEVCTDILELKSTLAGQVRSALTHYSGDFQTYENTVEENKIAQGRARVAYEKEKDKLREFISREGKKYDNPAHQAQRRMKIKQLESLLEVEKVDEDSELQLVFPRPYCVFDSRETILRIKELGFAFPSQPPLFSQIDFTVGPKTRMVVLGKNGCGKTTLLNLLIGDDTPTTGQVSRHLGARITMLQQHHYKGEQLDPNLNPLDHMRRLPQEASTAVGQHDLGTRQEETAQRSYLSNFGIQGARAVIPVKYLSGGQRMRVAMAVALYKRPDLLILDEPTNHLDSDTVRALCAALETYEGAIIAVSHDEAFVNRVLASAKTVGDSKVGKQPDLTGGELWVMSKARLTRFDGSFKEYKKMILKKVINGETIL